MIRYITLACGCKVELTVLPTGATDLSENVTIQGVLTYPCKYHRGLPDVGRSPERLLIQGLN